MARYRIGPVNRAAERLIPPAEPDGSEIGVNYADAYLEALDATLPDGRAVSCERYGLQITLQVGEAKGEALLRRLEHGPDVRNILHEAMQAAAQEAGVGLAVEDGVIYVDA